MVCIFVKLSYNVPDTSLFCEHSKINFTDSTTTKPMNTESCVESCVPKSIKKYGILTSLFCHILSEWPVNRRRFESVLSIHGFYINNKNL